MNRTLAAAAALAILAGPALAAEFQVRVSNFVFEPETLTVQVGDTVTWTNEQGLHNVNAPGFFRCANGCDGEGGDGDPALPPWSFSRTFTEEAVIDYNCEVHIAFGMTGRVRVVAGGGPTLAVTGTCPGSVTIAVSGGTPNGRVGLLFSRNPGNDDVGVGPCADTMTGLDNPRFLAPMRLNGQGNGSLQATAPPAACGALLQGIAVEGRSYAGGWWDWLSPFSVLVGVSLVCGYALLGATWLIMKTEGAVQDHCYRLALWLGIGTVLAMVAVSLATPFLKEAYWQRWFTWPQVLFTAQVPLLVAIASVGFFVSLRRRATYWPFLIALALFALGLAGLGISLYPYVVPGAITIWEAAAPDKSLSFMLVGAAIMVPIILAYTGYSYWVFRGKVGHEGYH